LCRAAGSPDVPALGGGRPNLRRGCDDHRVRGGGTIGGITSYLKAVEPVRTAFLKSVEDGVRTSRFAAACAGRTVTIEFQFSLGGQVGAERVSFAHPNPFTIFAPAKVIQGFNR
jgi:hypothetical protein